MTRLVIFMSFALAAWTGPAFAQSPSVHRHTVTSIDGEPVSLERYSGKVLLVVNTASRCGFTPQYAGLEKLYQRFKDRGLVVLGFPCNDFGRQEPGSELQIKQFCADRYSVSFPLFAKVKVRGEGQAPLYADLTASAGAVRWNFTKFLVDHEGRVLQRFDSRARPLGDALVKAVETALAARRPSARAYRVADYFPLSAERSFTYRKTVRRQGGRAKAETLRRQPRWIQREEGRVLRIEDSEGEFQDYMLQGRAPAMGGQSMVAQGFVQTYDPPISLLPAQARVGEAQRFVSQVRHKTGARTQIGRIERRVVLEGIEDVQTPAGTFRGCLRFKVSSTNSPDVRGNFLATSEDTVWLAPGVGEVKSVSRAELSTGGTTWMRATIELELLYTAQRL